MEYGANNLCQAHNETVKQEVTKMKEQRSMANTQDGNISDPRSKHKGKRAAHIAYVFDDSYAPIGGVSITSLFENNRDIDEMTVYIFTDGFSEENEKRFAQLAEKYDRKIVIMDIAEKVQDYKSKGLKPHRGAYITYIKMFLPDYFPEDVSHIVYIDADTLILRSISLLLEPVPLLAMPKYSPMSYANDVIGYEHTFCSECIVINAKRWRAEAWSAKLLHFLQTADKHYMNADEGIMNVVFKDKITKLPLSFNFEPVFLAIPKKDILAVNSNLDYTPEEISSQYDAPVIIHMIKFFGSKPWQAGTLHPAKEYFDTWLNKSLWNDYKRLPYHKTTLDKIKSVIYKIFPSRLCYRLWLASQRRHIIEEMKRLNEQ